VRSGDHDTERCALAHDGARDRRRRDNSKGNRDDALLGKSGRQRLLQHRPEARVSRPINACGAPPHGPPARPPSASGPQPGQPARKFRIDERSAIRAANTVGSKILAAHGLKKSRVASIFTFTAPPSNRSRAGSTPSLTHPWRPTIQSPTAALRTIVSTRPRGPRPERIESRIARLVGTSPPRISEKGASGNPNSLPSHRPSTEARRPKHARGSRLRLSARRSPCRHR